MALSNTATPIYYGQFREAVLRGDVPINREIAMEMERIDDLIRRPEFGMTTKLSMDSLDSARTNLRSQTAQI